MRSINSTAYDLVNGLGERIKDLKPDTKAGIYLSPYTEKPMDFAIGGAEGLTMFAAEDIAFCNTADFVKTGKTYIQTGKYTNAHPIYDKREYDSFWDEEERRCKEGYTVPGKLIRTEDGELKLQEIHITGEHYGYLNFGEIKRSKGFEIAKGALLSENGEAITTSIGGSSKDFYFPDFWDGDYYFFKAIELCRKIGKHLVVGKARRKGYSYKNGWIVANKANLYRRSNSVCGAYDAASLTDDGIMNKVQNYLDFINKHTDWRKRRLHNTLEHIQIGYRVKGQEPIFGFNSQIHTAVLKGNPGGMRGKDADLMLLEEAGKCPNMSDILDATLKTLSDGVYTTGLFVAFGTGGGDDNQWQGFEDLFYEPYARQFISFENIWDKDALGSGCGYFHGMFMNKPGLVDVHGNSDIKRTILFDDAEKASKKNNPAKLNAHEMEEPSMPSQAFSRAANGMFASISIELNDQLARCLRDPALQGLGREGIFTRGNNGIKFIDRLTANEFEKELIPPIVDNFPHKLEDDLKGCWILWEQPYRDKVTGAIPDDLYSAWNDPYGISKDKEHYNVKDSLASTFLYENPNNFTSTKGDRVIGMFVGRREDTEEYDDQMFLGLLYYNAKLLYENDRGDVYINAKKRGLLELLKDEPEFQHQKELQRGGQGRKKGISIATNTQRKLSGVVYLKNWLIQVRGVDANGNKLLNLHYIYSIGWLRELLKYDGKRNTDRTSCAIVGMFDIRETLNKGIVPETNRVNQVEDDYFNSPFGFSNNSNLFSDSFNDSDNNEINLDI